MYATTSELDAVDNNNVEVSAEGENMVTMALRTLRLNKSTPFSQEDPEMVLTEEKCRRIYSLSEVADHDNYKDCWIVLYDRVYNVTEFLNQVETKCESFVDLTMLFNVFPFQ